MECRFEGRPSRRPAARSSQRHLSLDAGGDVRRRARPDRLRRPLRHAEGQTGHLRDVLQLRRGCPPFGPGAGRHAEALRKLDQQFGRIDRARRYSPRPYEIVVLSDHGQTQGATFKQRNGYSLEDLVARSLAAGDVAAFSGGDEQNAMVGLAVSEATGTDTSKKKPKSDVSDRQVVVMGSGNLGLIYLMDERRRMTLEEIDARHPELISALREHPHVGWLLVRSEKDGAALGRGGVRYLTDDRIEGEDPLAHSPAAEHSAGRTASQTSRTSWSGASTIRSSTRAARSKSSSASTVAWVDRRRGPSSCIRRRSPFRTNRSSALPRSTLCSGDGASSCRTRGSGAP